tara:strand:+ start:1661 stop:2083 length:423 start_codon:yes stop_codon:yes gene_type:complete
MSATTRNRPASPLRFLRGTLRWAPVWVPSVLLWQVTTRGLWPALVERDRLETAAPDVRAIEADSSDEYGALLQRVEAQNDPIYRRRMERAHAADMLARERAASGRTGDGQARDGETGDGALPSDATPADTSAHGTDHSGL